MRYALKRSAAEMCKISATVASLKLWIDDTVANGKIDKAMLARVKESMGK